MLDPNKHGIYNKEGYEMKDSRLKQLAWLGIMILNTGIWYSIFTNGFFITLIWVIVIAAIAGIIIKLKENV
mgnify:CR=1 FL=1